MMMSLCTRNPQQMEQIRQRENGGEGEGGRVRNYFFKSDYGNCVVDHHHHHHHHHESEEEDEKEEDENLYNHHHHHRPTRLPPPPRKPFGSRAKEKNRSTNITTATCLCLIFVLAISSLIPVAFGDDDNDNGSLEDVPPNPPTTTQCFRHKSSAATNVNNQTANGTLKCVVSLTGHDNNKSLTISRSIVDEVARRHDLSFKTGNPTRKDKIHTLDVTCPSWPTPTRDSIVNFTELNHFLPTLETIIITGCNLTKEGLKGAIPRRLRMLNLSNNTINSLPDRLFIPKGQTKLLLSSINLSNNENLSTLPKSLLDLPSVQKVWLSRHNMTCPWVAGNLFKWFERNVLMDADKSDCRLVEYSIPLTTYGALRAKYDESVECKKTLASCNCSIYTVQYTDTLKRTNFPVSFQSHGENVSITLQVDCSFRNLTQLPKISPLTRFLNVSHNKISHIDDLNKAEYKNLGTLIAEYNQIENIDSVVKTNFVGQFDAFALSHNNISSLSHQVMSVLLDIEVKGHGRISLGENYINCDCDTARFVQPLLAQHQKRIADAKRLFCRNWPTQVKVQELEYKRVCQLDYEEEHNMMWYAIIVVEVFLILMILVKVEHDRRQYRQTGVLPFLSIQMPRLPCDAMLEGFKERPNGR